MIGREKGPDDGGERCGWEALRIPAARDVEKVCKSYEMPSKRFFKGLRVRQN